MAGLCQKVKNPHGKNLLRKKRLTKKPVVDPRGGSFHGPPFKKIGAKGRESSLIKHRQRPSGVLDGGNDHLAHITTDADKKPTDTI